MSRTFSIKTLGCKLNQYESDRITESLTRNGWIARPFGEEVDAVIVNTCTVTDRSDRKSRHFIRRGARQCRAGRTFVTGCLVDRDREGVEALPGVAAALGNGEKHLLHRRLEASTAAGHAETLGSVSPPPFRRTRGYLKIQDGCDGGCSFCVVPLVRGRPRSKNVAKVLAEARRLLDEGCPELILTGITIGKYRDGNRDLAGLVEEIVALPGQFRLRLTSVEPGQVTPELVALLSHPRVCRHLHLPLQSGSDRILRRMRRPYRSGEYRDLVERIRDRVSSVAIGTDVIVGFPGEEERDFSETVDLLREVGVVHLHPFTFSPRSGTAAAEMDAVRDPQRIRERLHRLQDLSSRFSLAYRSSFVGRRLPAVIEETKGAGTLTAISDNYIKISLEDSPANRRRVGILADVDVIAADRNCTRGRAADGRAVRDRLTPTAADPPRALSGGGPDGR
jgi:threonylcarbamoyladenosine tRNA methylthiotransferase MtaB